MFIFIVHGMLILLQTTALSGLLFWYCRVQPDPCREYAHGGAKICPKSFVIWWNISGCYPSELVVQAFWCTNWPLWCLQGSTKRVSQMKLNLNLRKFNLLSRWRPSTTATWWPLGCRWRTGTSTQQRSPPWPWTSLLAPASSLFPTGARVWNPVNMILPFH